MKLGHVQLCMVMFVCYFTTLTSMDQSKNAPHVFLKQVIMTSLKNKDSNIFFKYRHQTTTLNSYEDQNLFAYDVSFADPEIDTLEKLNSCINERGQAEYKTFFKEIMKQITELTKSDACEEDIHACVEKAYKKLDPLVWRLHLLWFLRLKISDILGEALFSISRYTPSMRTVLTRFFCLTLFIVISYIVFPDTFFYHYIIIPFLSIIVFHYDMIIKIISQPATIINYEECVKYQMWAKITEEFAHTMEKTYRTL